MKPPLHIQGMHGLGDNLHQRAVMRQLMPNYSITLETSWPSVYHDLIAEGLCVTRRPVGLRTQAKNANRESEGLLYSARHPLTRAGMRIAYTGHQVLRTPSKTVLEAMCNATGTNFETADCRLPIPSAWKAALFKRLGTLPSGAGRRPWLLYRPLVARPEWKGSVARNADAASYVALFNSIRDKFFVVSVADLEPGREWLVGPEVQADMAFHAGELVFEELAALFSFSDVIFTSSGFGAILGPAVSVPTISIVGGYESVACHDSGKRWAPMLSIGPERECTCWSSMCPRAATCDKSFNVATAEASILRFLEQCPGM